jgi:hypothetical protein
VLAFFAASDGIVLENLAQRFMSDIENSEIRAFYSMQIFMENIHCVTGNTKILTSNGYFPIEQLENKNVKVWNGTEFSSVNVKYTGNQEIYKVVLNNGMELDCTPNHKWLIYNQSTGEIQRIETIQLKTDDMIVDYELPILDCFSLKKEDEILHEPYLEGRQIAMEALQTNIAVSSSVPFYYIPLNHGVSVKMDWLSGVLSILGILYKSSLLNETFIQISNMDKQFLKDIQLLFTTMGVLSWCIPSSQECEYRLVISNKYFSTLLFQIRKSE